MTTLHRARPSTFLVIVTVVALTFLAACGSSADRSTSSAVAARNARPCPTIAGPDEQQLSATGAGVSRVQVTLADRNRASVDQDCRVLRTQVRFPTSRTHALPLIVVAHGRDGDPSALAPLLDAWARAGYVVAAPKLPTTPKDERGNSVREESAEQARDLSFVVTELLHRDASSASSAIHGLINPTKIGAAGMSLGGLAIYGLISNTCCRDRRIDAAILMAAVRRQFPGEQYEPNHAPVFLVQGDADPGYHNSVEGYPELTPPKWFLTLHGSGHAPPFEVPPGPNAPLAYRSTTLFWDRYLGGNRAAGGQIVKAVEASNGRGTLQHDPGP